MTFRQTRTGVHTRTWGDGPRQALLVHGIMSSADTWHSVAPRLAAHGYRVTALDLGGHGLSHRGPYSLQAWEQDVLSVAPARLGLAIGHSLGAVVLSGIIDRLQPARAVYSDPAWRGDPAGPGAREFFAGFKNSTEADIRARSPRWSDLDVHTDIESLVQWDLDTLDAIEDLHSVDRMPDSASVPSLVQLGGDSFIRTPTLESDARERGFEVRVLDGAGHNIHRDDLDAFMGSLEGWL
ncbi:alpha/beta fold hydrolase [Microbacterium halotolerans]|uniref:alpha/beta fold hydrolase n=1 Tax=Microbacterium halotolerans TaxID=246613 RepID=UPI000E6A9C0D|nr:alpha/beta hydrolase [Microbacterium halotolerans]